MGGRVATNASGPKNQWRQGVRPSLRCGVADKPSKHTSEGCAGKHAAQDAALADAAQDAALADAALADAAPSDATPPPGVAAIVKSARENDLAQM